MWPVIGHGLVVARLKNSFHNATLGHAYLISGPHNIGKMTLALTLAQALNCHQPEPPCGVCPACRRIISAKHPDVQVVALGSSSSDDKIHSRTEISIKQVRDDIQHWVNLPPLEGDYRVFIIGEAELLSSEAANCLLKTLEEPQERVLFLLLSSDPSRLPETVISRCQRLDLRPVAVAKIEAALLERGVSNEKACLLSRLSQGCPGWALTAASDGGVLERRNERLHCLLGVISGNLEIRFEFAAELSARFAQKRTEVQEVLEEWLGVWRDLLLLKAGMDLEMVNLDYADQLKSLADGFDINEVRKGITAVSLALRQLRQNASPRLVLEVMMLDMPVAKIKSI